MALRKAEATLGRPHAIYARKCAPQGRAKRVTETGPPPSYWDSRATGILCHDAALPADLASA